MEDHLSSGKSRSRSGEFPADLIRLKDFLNHAVNGFVADQACAVLMAERSSQQVG
jgi:hypothetical protein